MFCTASTLKDYNCILLPSKATLSIARFVRSFAWHVSGLQALHQEKLPLLAGPRHMPCKVCLLTTPDFDKRYILSGICISNLALGFGKSRYKDANLWPSGEIAQAFTIAPSCDSFVRSTLCPGLMSQAITLCASYEMARLPLASSPHPRTQLPACPVKFQTKRPKHPY